MKVIPAKGLSSKEASFLFSEEIRDLQESGEDSLEITVSVRGSRSAQSQAPMADEQIVTFRRDIKGGEGIALEGLGNPIRLAVRKSGVGTAELLLDEIEGTFHTQSVARN
jgi:hypothetical protein